MLTAGIDLPRSTWRDYAAALRHAGVAHRRELERPSPLRRTLTLPQRTALNAIVRAIDAIPAGDPRQLVRLELRVDTMVPVSAAVAALSTYTPQPHRALIGRLMLAVQIALSTVQPIDPPNSRHRRSDALELAL